jgi:hypothetical protein
MKNILACALLAAFTVPALAQTTTVETTTRGGDSGFYIVRDSTTKRCTVTRERPTTSTVTIVGDGTVYKTETEAQSAVKTTKTCTTD